MTIMKIAVSTIVICVAMASGLSHAASSECQPKDKARWEQAQRNGVKQMVNIWLSEGVDKDYTRPVEVILQSEALLFTKSCYSVVGKTTISDIADTIDDELTGDRLSFEITRAALAEEGIEVNLNNLMKTKGVKVRRKK